MNQVQDLTPVQIAAKLGNTIRQGKLKIIERYDFNDCPCLYSCQEPGGQIYLSLWIESNEHFNLWFMVPMSQERFDLLRSSGIDLHDVFIQSESSHVYYRINPDSTPDIVIPKHCGDIHKDLLPDPGEFLF